MRRDLGILYQWKQQTSGQGGLKGDLKKKLKVLKCTYNEEGIKIHKSVNSGSGRGADVYECTYVEHKI